MATGKDVDWRFAMQEDAMTRTSHAAAVAEAWKADNETRGLTALIHRLNFPLRKRTITPDGNDEHVKAMEEFLTCKLFNIRQHYIRRQVTGRKIYETVSDINFQSGRFANTMTNNNPDTEPLLETERCYQCGVGNNLVELRPCTECHKIPAIDKDILLKQPNLRPMFCGIYCQEIFRETVHAIPQGSCHGMIVKVRNDGSNCFIYPGSENRSDPVLYHAFADFNRKTKQARHHMSANIEKR